MRLTITLAALPALALAACGAPAEDTAADADATETPMPVEPDGGIGDGATPPADDSAPDDATASIPGALQGRWGLVAADCTSTRGDAKGLIEVTDDTITFYESRATLADVAERSDTRIRAEFAFIGEGMQWTRDIALETRDGGETLVRTEFGEDAMAEPLTYTKCAA